MEKIDPRELFTTHTIAAATRPRAGLTLTGVGWFEHEGVTYRIEATTTPEGYVLSATGSDGGYAYRTEVGTTEQALFFAARAMWDALAVHTSMKQAREIKRDATCEGGNISCKADAVWAFRVDHTDAWQYACGRHLTAALIYDCNGEQAEFLVRRIKTQEK